MEMVIQRFLGFLGRYRILGNICSFEWLVAPAWKANTSPNSYN